MSAILSLTGDFGDDGEETRHIIIPNIISIQKVYTRLIKFTMIDRGYFLYECDNLDEVIYEIKKQIDDFYKNYDMYVKVIKK